MGEVFQEVQEELVLADRVDLEACQVLVAGLAFRLGVAVVALNQVGVEDHQEDPGER